MKYSQQFLFIILFITVLNAQAPQIYHQVPEKLYYDQFGWLNCVVDPGEYHLLGVSIFIKGKTENQFTEYPMRSEKGIFVFQIIPEMVSSDSFIYFISAEFSDFALVAFPADNPKENPIVVPVVEETRLAKIVDPNDVAKLFCDLGRNIDNIRTVTIYTRYGRGGRFKANPMTLSKERFRYTVKEPGEKNEKLYYYIVILFSDQTTLFYPSDEFENNPDYRILEGRRK